MAVFQTSTEENSNTPTGMDYPEEFHFSDQIIVALIMIHTIGGFLFQLMPTPNNEDGQSAIEFVLVFAFALGLSFLFVVQSLNMTKGYVAHYVNFMASRIYLTFDNGVEVIGTNLALAEEEAQKVFEYYNLASIGLAMTMRVVSPAEGGGLFTGTVTEFSERLSALPIIGGSDEALFYSESFLGKEPLRGSCYQLTCEAISGSKNGCNQDTMDITVYDNGC